MIAIDFYSFSQFSSDKLIIDSNTPLPDLKFMLPVNKTLIKCF